MNGGGPVLRGVAVHVGGELAYSKRDVRAGTHSNVIKGADESTVRGSGTPFSDFGQNGNVLIRASEDEPCNHRHLGGVGISLVEPIDDLVDECRLG